MIAIPIALAEDYPDLKADEAFLALQKDLTDVENTIQYQRAHACSRGVHEPEHSGDGGSVW